MTSPQQPPPVQGEDFAEALKARLRRDLKAAMQARASAEIRVLRALIAALDNAQAVPVAPGHQRYVEHAFGDPAAEIPRLRLDAAPVLALLGREARERLDAADQFTSLGRADRASELQAEAAVVARYLAG